MEFLKGAISDELYSQLETELKDNDKVKLANLADGDYVSKDKYEALETEARGYKEQLEDLNKSLDTVKKQNKDNSEVQEQITELQNKYENEKKELEKTLHNTKLNSALELAIVKSGARSAKAVKGMLDMDKIKFDNDTLVGLDEQMKQIQTEHDYLFETPSKLKTAASHQSTGIQSDDTFFKAMREGAGLK